MNEELKRLLDKIEFLFKDQSFFLMEVKKLPIYPLKRELFYFQHWLHMKLSWNTQLPSPWSLRKINESNTSDVISTYIEMLHHAFHDTEENKKFYLSLSYYFQLYELINDETLEEEEKEELMIEVVRGFINNIWMNS